MQLIPAAIGAISTAATASPLATAATLVGGYASYAKAKASNAALLSNANAIGQEAKQVQQQGIQEQVKTEQKASQVAGQQIAGYAGAGIDTTSGTGAAVANQTKQLGAIDTMTIQSNTLNQLNQLKTEQQGMLSSVQNPWLAAGSTILTNSVAGRMFSGLTGLGPNTAGSASVANAGFGPVSNAASYGRQLQPWQTWKLPQYNP